MNIKLHRLTMLESRITSLYTDGKYNEAIIVAKDLLENAEKTEDFKAMMNAYMNITASYYYLGEIESAFESFLQYKLLCDEYGDDRDKYYLYSLSALIYEFEGNYKEAKLAIKECIHLALELEMYYSASVSYNTYSSYLIIEEEYEKGLEYAYLALNLAKDTCPGDILLQCQIYFNVANALVHMGQLSEAQEILEPLEVNPYIQNNIHEKAHYLYVLSMLYYHQNDYDRALTYLKESFDILLNFNDYLMLKTIAKITAEIYEEIGNYKLAFSMMKEYVSISEKLYSLRLSSRVKELDIKNSIDAIEARANIDSLTGVFNRYYLETACNNWLKQAKKTGENICFIVFDVDYFKNINDTFGHLIGDEVIKAVGNSCLELSKKDQENIIVGRYGGDEFVVILRNYSTKQIAELSKQLFTIVTNKKLQYLNNTIQITISMGVICTDSVPSAKKFTQVFKIADQALYMAKKQGKNQIVFLSKDNCHAGNCTTF